MKCENCGSSWQIADGISDSMTVCPFCGTKLISNPEARDVRSALRIIVEKRGIEIYNNEQMLNALLSDLAAYDTANRKKFKAAMSVGAGRQFLALIQSTGKAPSVYDVREFKQSMLEMGFRDEYIAIFTEMMFYSADIKMPKDDKPTPTHKPASEPAPAPASMSFFSTSPSAPGKYFYNTDNHVLYVAALCSLGLISQSQAKTLMDTSIRRITLNNAERVEKKLAEWQASGKLSQIKQQRPEPAKPKPSFAPKPAPASMSFFSTSPSAPGKYFYNTDNHKLYVAALCSLGLISQSQAKTLTDTSIRRITLNNAERVEKKLAEWQASGKLSQIKQQRPEPAKPKPAPELLHENGSNILFFKCNNYDPKKLLFVEHNRYLYIAAAFTLGLLSPYQVDSMSETTLHRVIMNNASKIEEKLKKWRSFGKPVMMSDVTRCQSEYIWILTVNKKVIVAPVRSNISNTAECKLFTKEWEPGSEGIYPFDGRKMDKIIFDGSHPDILVIDDSVDVLALEYFTDLSWVKELAVPSHIRFEEQAFDVISICGGEYSLGKTNENWNRKGLEKYPADIRLSFTDNKAKPYFISNNIIFDSKTKKEVYSLNSSINRSRHVQNLNDGISFITDWYSLT